MERLMLKGEDCSVVIPTIEGREELCARAIKSVNAQTVVPKDIIVVPDHDRKGAAWARNFGLDKVKTDVTFWLDDDDEFLPNHVSTLLRAMNSTGADLVFSYPVFVGGHDPLACVDNTGVLIPEPIDIPFGRMQEMGLRQLGNYIPVTYAVKTEIMKRVGGMPEPYSFLTPHSNDCEDYLALIKLLDAGARFYHVCGIRTWKYYYHAGNLGGRGVNRMHELG
jgi:glycosyltransferase involved in cell wall biosynthesis